MKNKILTTGLVLLVGGAAALAHGNKPGKAVLQVSNGEIAIEYTGPALKGRDFTAMIKQPGANPWRLGADRATTLTTPADLHFGEGVLGSGSYVLRAYLDESGSWWLQAYNSDKKMMAKLPLESAQAADSKENLEIALSGSGESATVTIQWGTTTLHGSFSVAD